MWGSEELGSAHTWAHSLPTSGGTTRQGQKEAPHGPECLQERSFLEQGRGSAGLGPQSRFQLFTGSWHE